MFEDYTSLLKFLIQEVLTSCSIESSKYLLTDGDVSLLFDELCCKFTFQPVQNYQFSRPVSNTRLVCSSLLNDFRNTLKCIIKNLLILYKSCLPWRNTRNKKMENIGSNNLKDTHLPVLWGSYHQGIVVVFIWNRLFFPLVSLSLSNRSCSYRSCPLNFLFLLHYRSILVLLILWQR